MSDQPSAINFKIYKTLNRVARVLNHLIAKGDTDLDRALEISGNNRIAPYAMYASGGLEWAEMRLVH